MFEPSIIQNSLFGIVGCKNPYNPEYAILNTDNQKSDSGLFVTDNPMVKIELLKETQDFKSITTIDFNTFLSNLQKKSITDVCYKIFDNPSYIDRNLIYSNALNKVETEVLPVGFIGFKVKVSDKKNIAFKITRVLLDFNGTGSIKLMLFNSGIKTAIFTKDISITTDHQSEELNWVVNNNWTTYKGDYYLGYISNNLTVSPFKRDYENSNLINNITYLDIQKISIPSHITNTIFDLSKINSLNETSGLNFDITVYEDFTDLIIQNKMLFSRCIYLQFAIAFIQTYEGSLRSNRSERVSNDMINRLLLELEGTENNKGLKAMLVDDLSTLKKNIDNLKIGYFGTGYFVDTID